MLVLPTVLLRHWTREGTHYDWLIGDPRRVGERDGRLWTARVPLDSGAWAAAGRFDLVPLPPHRRVYLRYQGPVSGDRGTVRRVDAGVALARQWTAGRLVLDVRLRRFAGRVTLWHLAPARWRARVGDLAATPTTR